MNYKKILIGLFVLSILSMIVGYAIRHPVEVGLCPQSTNQYDIKCERSYLALGLGMPLSVLPILPALVFVILFFLPEEFFNNWRQFAKVYLILGIISIYFAPKQSYDFMFPVDKKLMSWLLGILFFIISLSMIAYHAYISHRKKMHH